MTKPTTGRRWRVVSTGYFGTPKASSAKTPALRRKYRMEGGPTTAAGDRVSIGDIAVPSNVALGSKIFVPGYGWGIAKDHGGAIKGNRIDLAFGGVNAAGTAHNPEAEKKALSWGRRSHTVYVFPPTYQIPVDHSPPQAYRNDVANKGKTSTRFSIASILPESHGSLPSRSITSKKEAKPIIEKALKAEKNKPVIPTIVPATSDSKAWWSHVDSWDRNEQLHGESDPSKFLDWSNIGSRAYRQKIDNILNSGNSPEQQIASIMQIQDGIKYQKVKGRMIHKDAQAASDYADSKIESIQSSVDKPKVEPAAEEKFVLKNTIRKPDLSKTVPLTSNSTVSTKSTAAAPRRTTAIPLQQTVDVNVRTPSIPIKKPKINNALVKDQAINTSANPAKPQTPSQTIQTSLPVLSGQVRNQVTKSTEKATIHSNADPKLKGPTGQVVTDLTHLPRTNKIRVTGQMAEMPNEPPPVDPVKTAAPKITSQETQSKKPNSVLTNYIKRINTIDSLVDPSQYLQRKKLFLKEQATIKDVNNGLSNADRSRLLDTLGAYPEDNRKPQTLGGVVRAGNNDKKWSDR